MRQHRTERPRLADCGPIGCIVFGTMDKVSSSAGEAVAEVSDSAPLDETIVSLANWSAAPRPAPPRPGDQAGLACVRSPLREEVINLWAN